MTPTPVERMRHSRYERRTERVVTERESIPA